MCFESLCFFVLFQNEFVKTENKTYSVIPIYHYRKQHIYTSKTSNTNNGLNFQSIDQLSFYKFNMNNRL